jgi:hypothetical protein
MPYRGCGFFSGLSESLMVLYTLLSLGYTAGDWQHAHHTPLSRAALAPLHCCPSTVAPVSQVAAKDLAQHLAAACEHRFVPCVRAPKCHLRVRKHQQREHDVAECREVACDCPLGCSVSVLRKDMAHHVAKECVLRIVPCGAVSGRGYIPSISSPTPPVSLATAPSHPGGLFVL